jgi:uncharacterized protein YlxW (UPF0749 family)
MLAELMENHLDAGYAAAAKRRVLAQPLSAMAQRVRSVSSAATLVVIGVVLAMGYHQQVTKAPDVAQAKASLVDDINRRSTATDNLQRRADLLRAQVAHEREAALADSEAGQQTAEELRKLESVTGLGRVTGPGLVVTVGDGPPPKDPVTGEPTGEPDLGRVQDRDLQELVNALWRSGAEAIAIDGQRLTPTSTIRLAGEAVLVELRPVTSPYRIEAIGDPDGLDSEFNGSGIARRFRSYIQRYEMTFKVSRAGKLSLAASPGSPLVYARERGATRSPTPSAPASPRPHTSPSKPVPSATGGGR